jgi:hypothetical protein
MSTTSLGIRAQRFDEEEFPKQRRRNAFLFMQSIPPSYSSAVHSLQKQDWELAMDKEMKSIQENETWTVIPNKGQKTIKCRWVYTRKTNGLFKDTRKSTTGFVSVLYGGAISWKSQLQKTVAQSTMESEYIALV